MIAVSRGFFQPLLLILALASLVFAFYQKPQFSTHDDNFWNKAFDIYQDAHPNRHYVKFTEGIGAFSHVNNLPQRLFTASFVGGPKAIFVGSRRDLLGKRTTYLSTLIEQGGPSLAIDTQLANEMGLGQGNKHALAFWKLRDSQIQLLTIDVFQNTNTRYPLQDIRNLVPTDTIVKF